MIDALVNAFTKGDLAQLKQVLLHSTCWNQHNAKAYGQDKLQAVVLNWLKTAGLCDVVSQSVISQDQHQVIRLELQPKGGRNSISYAFWLETNGKVIKSVDAIVDTMQLAFATEQTTEKVMAALPTPDAFVLQDYDQQDHLQNELAVPSNVAQLDADQAALLDNWWRIWSQAQLSEIGNVYAENAQINLPGSAVTSTPAELFNYVLDKYSLLTRVFCQIEQVAVEGDQAAIKWFLDGDEDGSRIRAPFITVLTIKDQQIVADATSSDILAHISRFNKSTLFNG